MPWLVRALSSAVRCMAKSNECELQNSEESVEGRNERKTDQKCLPCLIINCSCCHTKSKKKKKQTNRESHQTSNKEKNSASGMSDNDNNNHTELKSKEKPIKEKKCGCNNEPIGVFIAGRGSLMRKKENRSYSSSSLPIGSFDRPEIKDFSKFHRAPNNPHRTNLCRHSSARLPSVYSSPRVMKWPNHRSFRETGTRPRLQSTTICPPPNRTIVKTEGRLVVSVTGNKQTNNHHSGDMLEKMSSDDGFRPKFGEKSPLSNNSKSNKDQCLRNTLHFPQSEFENNSPPEYSDPPDYYMVA